MEGCRTDKRHKNPTPVETEGIDTDLGLTSSTGDSVPADHESNILGLGSTDKLIKRLQREFQFHTSMQRCKSSISMSTPDDFEYPRIGTVSSSEVIGTRVIRFPVPDNPD